MNETNLASVLINRPNSYFRASQDESDPSYIYDTPINTARKILLQIVPLRKRSNHINLVAQPQVGKTSVICATINMIIKSQLYKTMCVNKYFILSGMNDVGLRDQTYERLTQQCMEANKDNIYTTKNSKRNAKKNMFFVLKNSDLLNYDGFIDNSVIFIDESHYGSNEKNNLTRFLVKHGIDWKNTDELVKRNIYIVSVSATPFNELVSDTANVKKIIELKASEDYVGITQFLEKNLIEEASKDDICPEGEIFEYIKDAHERMINNTEDGVIIIRTSEFETIKANPYVIANFDVFEMFSNGSKIEYDTLNTKFEAIYQRNISLKGLNQESRNEEYEKTKPLIVLIKGAFRAGISISTKYKDFIYMVYDYSVKADATCQALLGRLCGHRSENASVANTRFYINKKFASQYSTWENDFSNRDLIPCEQTKMEWVENDYKGDDIDFGTKSCGNFTIELSDEELLEIYRKCFGKKKVLGIMEEMFPIICERHNKKVYYDYMQECHMHGKNSYAKSSQEKRWDSYSESSLVFPFRPEKIAKFMADTNRDYLTVEDVGKKAISLVLDATINVTNDVPTFGGNKRLLVYYVEVGLKRRVYSRKRQYQSHKDTTID